MRQIFFVRGCVNCVHALGERKKILQCYVGVSLGMCPDASGNHGVRSNAPNRLRPHLHEHSLPSILLPPLRHPCYGDMDPPKRRGQGSFSSGAACQLKRPKRLKTAARDSCRLTRCRIHVMCKSGPSTAQQSRAEQMELSAMGPAFAEMKGSLAALGLAVQ